MERTFWILIILQITQGKETSRTNYKRKAHGKDTSKTRQHTAVLTQSHLHSISHSMLPCYPCGEKNFFSVLCCRVPYTFKMF